MFRQNCLLRTHALGKFGPLLHAISKDPAMLVWLDSNSNINRRPNENYARELMELFSLGVGNFTEKDIREAARAFTGWRSNGEGFRFDARLHDSGPKTVLGQTGAWNGDDVVRIVLEQPATERFLVRKLYHDLVSENAAPPDSLLEPLFDSFRKSGYDLAGLVRTILASQHFYSSHAFRQRIKGPVDYVLGAVQAVYRCYPEEDADYRPLPQQALVARIEAMGQSLFAPPNVKGWPGGSSWLNTSTVLERDNFAGDLALGTLWPDLIRKPAPRTAPPSGTLGQVIRKLTRSMVPADTPEEPAPPIAFDPARLLEESHCCDGSMVRTLAARAPGAEDIVGVLLDLYLPGGVRSEPRAKLVAFMSEGHPVGAALDRRVREAVHAILTMPEFQLS
jgi:hypothetical protein